MRLNRTQVLLVILFSWYESVSKEEIADNNLFNKLVNSVTLLLL